MSMFVILPQAVEIANNFKYSIAQCVAFVVDNDERYARPSSKIRAGIRCVKAFENPQPCDEGLFAELKDEDHEFLRQVFENPSEQCGFGKWQVTEIGPDGSQRLADARVPPRSFISFPDAISEAKHERPKLTPPPTDEAAT